MASFVSPANGVSQAAHPFSSLDAAWVGVANASLRAAYVIAPFTWRGFNVTLTTAPGAGITRTFTVYRDGQPTILTQDFPNTTTAAPVTGAVQFGVGDVIWIQADVTGGTALAAGTCDMYGVLEGAAQNVFAQNTTALSNTVTTYASMQGGMAHALQTVENTVQGVMPCAGTFSLLRCDFPAGAITAGSYAVTLRVNGVDTALTVTMDTTAQSFQDATHSVSVNAGDLVCIAATPTGTPTSRALSTSILFTPTTAGQSFVLYGSSGALSASAVRYVYPIGQGNAAPGTTETNHDMPLPAGVTVDAIYADFTTAPGTSKQFAIQSRINAANNGPSFLIAGTATTGNNGTDSTVTAAGDLLDVSLTPTGTPTLPGNVHLGVAFKMPTITESILNFAGAENQTAAAPTYGGANYATGTVSVVASPMTTGGYAFRTNPTGFNVGRFLFTKWSPSGISDDNGLNVATAWYEFLFRAATISSAVTGEEICDARHSLGSKAHVRLQSDGKLAIYDSTNTLVATGATVLAPNTDYVIGLKIGTGAAAAYTLRVNGINELTGTLNATTSNNLGLSLGKTSDRNGTNVDYYFDNFIAHASTFPDGKYLVKTVFPNGAGDLNEWTAGTAPNDFSVVDDFSDASDYLKINTNGTTAPFDALFTVLPLASSGMTNATPQAIKIVGIVRTDSGSGATQAYLQTKFSGRVTGAAVSRSYSTTTLALQWMIERALDQNKALTGALVDGAQIGIGATNVNSNAILRCESLWMEVLYQAGSGNSLLALLGVG